MLNISHIFAYRLACCRIFMFLDQCVNIHCPDRFREKTAEIIRIYMRILCADCVYASALSVYAKSAWEMWLLTSKRSLMV